MVVQEDQVAVVPILTPDPVLVRAQQALHARATTVEQCGQFLVRRLVVVVEPVVWVQMPVRATQQATVALERKAVSLAQQLTTRAGVVAPLMPAVFQVAAKEGWAAAAQADTTAGQAQPAPPILVAEVVAPDLAVSLPLPVVLVDLVWLLFVC
jgi:hypothetical protein